MQFIEKFYGHKFLDKQKSLFDKMPIKREPPLLFAGEDEGTRLLRIQFDKYLELAFRHKVVDKNLQRRLKSSDWSIFQQARQELMNAFFFEQVLDFKISFHPKGNNNSIGDLLIMTPKGDSIFVEIKSPVQERPHNAWWGDERKAIYKNVKRAREQMDSNANIYNLVVISGELKDMFAGKSDGVIPALYGEHYVSFPSGPNVEEADFTEHFNPCGFFQPYSNTRISAVATLKENVFMSFEGDNHELKYNFYIYHNPYALKPIRKEIFGNYPQFYPIETGDFIRMDWLK